MDPIEHGRAQLIKRRERKLHLRLNPHRTQNTQIRRRTDRIIKQRGLPHPSLALQHQRPTPPGPRPIEQPVQHRTLVSPTAQQQPPRCRTTASHGQRDPRAKPFSRESGTEHKAAA
jgi:hypothetical protein